MKLILSGLFCLAVITGAGAATYLKTGDPVVSGGLAGVAGILSIVVLAPFFRGRPEKTEPAHAPVEGGTAQEAAEADIPIAADPVPAEQAEPEPAPARTIAPPGKLTEAQKEVISDFLRKSDLPQARWPAILNHCEAQMNAFSKQLTQLAEEMPQLTHTLADAADTIGAADFIAADTLLSKAGDKAEAGVAVRILELRAALARASGRPTNAAHLYAKAAALPADTAPRDWARLKAGEANSWFDRGRFAGETDTLARAVDVFQEAASADIQAQAPGLWAIVQDGLGLAQQAYGEHTDDPESLKGSIASFRETLNVRTRDSMPRMWAVTQAKLGTSFRALAKSGDPQARQEAITSFEQALEVLTEESAPHFYRIARNGLDEMQQNADT